MTEVEALRIKVAADMKVPTVHLNGTGKETLLREIEEAVRTLDAAQTTLRQVTVHGRDYYVQSADAYTIAREEMNVRLMRLEMNREELETMYRAIQEQGR